MTHKLFTTILSSLLAFSWHCNALANPNQAPESEIDYYCYRYPTNSICENKESYLSLDKWQENKTKCSLATEWEEKKCKVVVNNRELTIYVEQEKLSESFPNTLKTKVIKISLDNIFAFNTEWWLGNFKSPVTHADNIYGSFPNLEIGFVPRSSDSPSPSGKFLTISAPNLHRTIEEIESWRYYLPDMASFEEQFRFKSSQIKGDRTISSNIAILLETNKCTYCNLKNADLAGMDLEKANLQGANLAGANLKETKLKEAYLFGANLSQANLDDANLENANMMFASLENAHLVKANLKGANLQNANLNNALLNEAKLNARNAENTNLKNASLINVDLSDADLRCANLQSANLKNANLTNADLSSCEDKSSGISFSQIKNRGTLKNLRLNGGFEFVFGMLRIASDIISSTDSVQRETIAHLDTDLASANLNGANLTNANLKNANLTDVNFSQAIFDETKFFENNLSNANFINTDVSKVDFGEQPILLCEATFSDQFIYQKYCRKKGAEEEK
jgi:uncharacterized protein YjbI with pentapeptide repeats